MDKRQALKLLIEAAKRTRREYSIGHNAHEKGYQLDTFERDHKRYQQLTEAIAWAEAELEAIQTQEVKGD